MGNPPFEDVSPRKKLSFFPASYVSLPKELLIEFQNSHCQPLPAALSLEAENPICLNLRELKLQFFVDDEFFGETGWSTVVVEKPFGGF